MATDLPLRQANGAGNNEPLVDVAIASAPNDIAAVPGLLNDMSFLKNNLDVSSSREGRLYLLDKARALVQALETPRETMLKHVGAETSAFFTITLGIEVGLFKELARRGGTPKKSADLARAIGFDVDGLRRILRHLAAMGHIAQPSPDTYAPTNFSRALTIPIVADGYPFYRSVCIPPMLHLHKWLKTKSYATPTTGRDNPFTFGNQTDMSMFEFLAAYPPYNDQFNHHMGGYRLGRPAWYHPSVYPVEDRLIRGFGGGGGLDDDSYDDAGSQSPPTPSSPHLSAKFPGPDAFPPPHGSEVLLVDIGGNKGHDLLSFSAAFPSHPGRLVLQDQPSVLASIPPDTRAALTSARAHPHGHDFFTPEPIRHARAYYLHHILHDWPDDKCVDIVTNIRSAMKPGYTRLLVNEHVIPSIGANWEATYLDLYMMILFGARERTEDDWKALLEDKCGLKILQIWNPGNGVEAIIECEVPVA